MLDYVVWVFLLATPMGPLVLHDENFDTRKTCMRFAQERMRKTRETINCVRMRGTNNAPAT